MDFHTTDNLIHRRFRSWMMSGLLFVMVAMGTGELRADGWMFRRSYFSHDPPPHADIEIPQPISRSAYRPALVNTTPGFGIRGTRRYNTMFLRSGNSSDVTIYREDWFELTP